MYAFILIKPLILKTCWVKKIIRFHVVWQRPKRRYIFIRLIISSTFSKSLLFFCNHSIPYSRSLFLGLLWFVSFVYIFYASSDRRTSSSVCFSF
ncbi:ferrodoxin-like motif protein [Ranid herpesvirus 3]|uniref:Ferrodoxin-like motif protein n=1 Tax=Ranid herpesvirus 3 TaxID=1987509 RepID=A0A1X9T555_9VIRU|nr:ferrodoxin-like motif protein [Ranid herpesvirus 3]ARR28826.1 ferrodoxin-like motif protein [Ranid herpesvirus 3]